MDNDTIERLKEKVNTDPSVLFLGQDYLRSKTGKNLFYETINREFCDGRLSPKTDYTDMWKKMNGGEPLNDSSFEKMRSVLSHFPEQRWLRKILNMRWGMVITSSIDGALCQSVGQDFSIQSIDMDRRFFDRKYISKRTLNVSFLYGTIYGIDGAYPPKEYSRNEFMKRRKKVNDRIEWVYSDILSEYGYFVIDGWDPKYDWMDTLLNNAGEMPYDSIYLFGVNEDISNSEDVKVLVENGILRTDERSFAQALEEIGFFDDMSDDVREEYGADEKIVTINNDMDQMLLSIPEQAIMSLDSHIAVLYDDLWQAPNVYQPRIQDLYAKFQQQADMPAWYLYDDRYGFYFKRTLYQQLEDAVEKELYNTSYKRKYIMLEGNSNVGKTTMLVYLAYRKKNSVPVIYIAGEPTQPKWMEGLKDFIKKQLMMWQKKGKKVSSILVIWDANTDYHAGQRCKQLNDVLRECNSVVVGSAYRMDRREDDKTYYKDKAKNHHLLLTADLSPEEVDSMLGSLKKIGMDTQVRAYIDKNGAYLMHVLQVLHLQYREEWRLVSESLKFHFNREVEANEETVGERATKYIGDLAKKVDEEIQKQGIATAWQLKLEKIKREFGWDRNLNKEKQKKLDRFEHVEGYIKKINKILAVSGGFSVYIPLTLILRMITTAEEHIFSDEQIFLIEVIENDSLLCSRRDDQGYVSVSFRHQIEAVMYVENNLGNSPDERKEKEVELLREMIAECKWYDEHESAAVLMLVRCFGPNSWGRINASRGKERHYIEYEKWWGEIAEALKDVINAQPEGVLVYAMLVRSYCRKEINQIEKDMTLSSDDRKKQIKGKLLRLNTAKRMLKDTIDQYDQNNTNQLCRLLGEICSNIVYEMKNSEEIVVCEALFKDLKIHFARAVKNWSENNTTTIFTKNALLDIWLNGVENYFSIKKEQRHIEPMEDPECADAVARSINYINELLDLTDDDFDNITLLNKVNDIYKYVKTDDLDKLQEEFERVSNDTFLYLKAWKCWEMQEDISFGSEEEKEYLRYYVKNLYLIPDDLDRLDIGKETATKLKEYAKKAASEALKILEEEMKLIKQARSGRCIAMLIRAKWLLYTGNMPLEIKQRPILTLDQWNEIGRSCKEYITYAEQKGEKLRDAFVFLRMVYVWSFSRDRQEIEQLQKDQGMLRTNEWYFERICLCNIGSDLPKRFKVNLQLRKGSNNKYIATVFASEDEIEDEIVKSVKNRQVHVPEFMAQELMGKEFGCAKFNIKQSVVIWFNAKGPQIGLPEKGEK